MGKERDEFPVGMRVLAVDDDADCLKLLESILRQCKYHVTTTDQAIKALEMLRENKDQFDLIITDVQMPDIDGFKLLELVGLEKDLPVVMLSDNGDPKAVIKGITHGACDYLMKPVRIEEIKIIWQHVIRKKRSVSGEHNNSDNQTFEAGQVPNTSSSSKNKISRKWKDHNIEDEEGGNEENMNENENFSTQKKPRVVWSVELHQKFMAAINHLGINKAVPRRILSLMNIPGITREHVASHLQKYRLYMKRRANQKAKPVSGFRGRNSYLPLTAVDSFGDFHSFTSSSQLSALPSFQHNGGLGRKDPTGLGHNNHGAVQIGYNNLNKLQHVTGSQQGNFIQSMPTLGVDQSQQQRRMINEVNNRFPAGGLGTGGSNNSMVMVTNSQISSGLPSICSGPFEVNATVTSNLPDSVRCNKIWQNSIPSTGTSNVFPMSSGVSPVVSQINCNPLSFSSNNSTLAEPLSHPSIANRMLMLKGTNEDSKYLNFGNVGNTPRQWREAKQDHTPKPNIVFSSSLNPPMAGQSTVDPTSHSQRLNNGTSSKSVFMDLNGQTNYGSLFLTQQCKNDESMSNGQLKYKDDFLLENSPLQGGLNSNGYNFDELVNIIDSEDALFMDDWH